MLNAAPALLNSLRGSWRSFVARISCRAMSTAELTRGRGATLEGSAFGRLLKEWRGRRGISQLGLALAARTTQRHVSFIESGRAIPSRDMVLRLGATMALPLRQQNALLLAAGYAPAWQERDLSMPDLAAINSALDYMLSHHEPYPAFVVDRCWNLLRANRGASSLTEFLLGPAPAETPPAPVNLAIALVSPDGLRPYIVNRQEVVRYFVRGVQADANADGTSATAHLLERLLFVAGVAGLPRRCRRRRIVLRYCRSTSAAATHRCGCSRRSPRSAHRETSPWRRSVSSSSFRSTTRRHRSFAGWPTADS